MRNYQILVLLLAVLLSLNGCFGFYEGSVDALSEHIVERSEGEGAEFDEPNIQLEVDSNGMEPLFEHVYVNGTVLSGAGDEDDVYIEIAFEEDHFNASAVEKYDFMVDELLDRENGISDGETFALTLSIESLMGNTSFTQTIYIKIYELDENETVQYSTILQNFSVIVPFIDSDDDGVTDEDDAFPYDANETTDADGDGVGDHADSCQYSAAPNTHDGCLSSTNEGEDKDMKEVPFIGFFATLSMFMLAVVFINNEQEDI